MYINFILSVTGLQSQINLFPSSSCSLSSESKTYNYMLVIMDANKRTSRSFQQVGKFFTSV